jgi:hypothetical protein
LSERCNSAAALRFIHGIPGRFVSAQKPPFIQKLFWELKTFAKLACLRRIKQLGFA